MTCPASAVAVPEIVTLWIPRWLNLLPGYFQIWVLFALLLPANKRKRQDLTGFNLSKGKYSVDCRRIVNVIYYLAAYTTYENWNLTLEMHIVVSFGTGIDINITPFLDYTH